MKRFVPAFALALFVLPSLLGLAPAARADVFTIYVAARDSPAHKAAEALVDGKSAFWAPKLARGLEKMVELLATTDNEVRVKVAQGTEAGFYELPSGLGSPKAKLLLLGGYCPDWKKRDPFGCPTELQAGSGRPQPTLSFGGNKTQFAELVVSGFLFDAASSNKYDAKTNSLLKGSSRTIPLLGLSQAVVSHLVIADNIFLNSAHKAFDVYHSPASNDAVVDIQNNFFLNNVIPMKIAPAGYKGFVTRTVRLRNNSFILNWPFNPDATSSNVGAVELYHKDCCAELVVEGNLFAYNAGGAMQHDWPTNRMPKLAIRKNLFFMNATLFGDGRPEAGVFTGKFGPSPRHQVIPLAAHMEDDFPYQFEGNVAIDPKVPVALVDLQAADSSAVTAKKTVMNDIRGLFGINKDGGTVAIKNFAPRMGLDVANLPFPAAPEAAAFGVQRGDVYRVE